MTALLEQAIDQARSLSDEEQNTVANLHLQTLANLKQDAPQARPQRQAGSAKGKIWMAPDFDEPLEDFKTSG